MTNELFSILITLIILVSHYFLKKKKNKYLIKSKHVKEIYS